MPEGGDVADVDIPVDRERMSLSVEGTGIILGGSAHLHDIPSEVDVAHQLSFDGSLTAFHNVAKRFPIVFVFYFVVFLMVKSYCHLPVFCYGG